MSRDQCRRFQKRKFGALLTLSVVSLLATSFDSGAVETPVERGKYLALLADCGGCHTQDPNRPFAGGSEFRTPFGLLVAPNITPDPETGIGTWTEAEFTSALREGVGKDGVHLYPAMPFTFYTKMWDEDVQALWAYFQTQAPIRHAVESNELRFPFNIRIGNAVWQALFLEPGRFEPDPARSAQWNRGAYIVEAFQHCGACHTPRNLALATDDSRALTGATVPGQGWYAPNIGAGSTSVLSNWSVEDIAQFLKTGTHGNSSAVGPMFEVIRDSTSRMHDEDRLAMAIYLKDPGTRPAPAPEPAEPLSTAAFAAGKAVYDANCSGCHQPNGAGVAGTAPDLRADAAVHAAEPFNVIAALLQGFDGRGQWSRMASFADMLDDRQMADVSNYVRRAWGAGGAELATPWMVREMRQVVRPTPGAERTVTCPHLPVARLDPETLAMIGGLGEQATDPAKIAGLVQGYASRHPDEPMGGAIMALTDGYCRSMEQAGVDPRTQMSRLYAFNGAVARAVYERSGAAANRGRAVPAAR